MEQYFLHAQIIGFIAFIISTVKYQLRGTRNILWTECVATSCWAIHVFLLGSIQAAIVNTIAVCRGVLCLKLPLRYTPYLVGSAFILATILIIPTIEKTTDIMPLLGFGFFGISFLFQNSPFKMRLSCIAGDSIWMFYALLIFSPPLAITCAISIISSCIGLYRFEKRKLEQLFVWRYPRTYP